jgi:hypothetical protein
MLWCGRGIWMLEWKGLPIAPKAQVLAQLLRRVSSKCSPWYHQMLALPTESVLTCLLGLSESMLALFWSKEIALSRLPCLSCVCFQHWRVFNANIAKKTKFLWGYPTLQLRGRKKEVLLLPSLPTNKYASLKVDRMGQGKTKEATGGTIILKWSQSIYSLVWKY